MSGSLPGGGVKAEPNLTPILDMVFQLITFFMLVINFKAAELDLSLQLPVLTSAKPLPDHQDLKFLVLNVQICTKCPHAGCEAMATLRRDMEEGTKRVLSYHLVCENGHETVEPQGAINKGKTCLSVYRRLLTKQSRGDTPSIVEYLTQEADLSMKAAKVPLTRDEIVKEGKELDDIVVIRADTTCPFGAVNYIITECQQRGYRKFALKTMHNDKAN